MHEHTAVRITISWLQFWSNCIFDCFSFQDHLYCRYVEPCS